jgi:3',5'-cyclic AMP phosphodiesterase CpdA
MHHRRLPIALAALVSAWAALAAQQVALPNAADSLKFAAIGDNGDGSRAQYEVGAQMARSHAAFPFELVIMLGDNMYGRQRPEDFVRKFERPYRPLLDAGVRFYASLGNHDQPENRFYELWNMGGERYYTYRKKNVRFFALDSNYMDPEQLEWLEGELRRSRDEWKIAYFHHPLYSSGARHGSEVDLRRALEPLFVRYGVDVVFSGHDHIYERIKPQRGIHYFVSGAGGKLRRGNLDRSSITAAGYDLDRSFMLLEVVDDRLYFQAVSRRGWVVDSGRIEKRARPSTTATAGAR